MVSSVNGSSSSYLEAQTAEADAQRRIQQAEESVRKVQQTSEEEAEVVRSRLQEQAQRQNEQQKLRLAMQEQENYESLRHLKNKYQSEDARVQNLGEKELYHTRDYYEHAATQESQRGQHDLKETQKHNFMALEAEMKGANERENFYRQDQINRVKSLEERKAGIVHESEKEQALIKARSDAQIENQKLHHEEKLVAFQKSLEEQQNQLLRAQDESNRRLQQALKLNERELSKYDSVKNDPFYQPLDIGAKVEEDGDFYVLTAKIPEHEQSTIKITGTLNEIVISGSRKNNLILEGDHGERKTTSNYQTFHEVFPTESPIDPSLVRKSFDGDELTAWIPKAGTQTLRQIKADSKVKTFDLGVGPKPLTPNETMQASRKPVRPLDRGDS